MSKFKLFKKDYINLKKLIDHAIQKNKDFLHFKGIKLSVFTAKLMYESIPKDIKD